MFGDIDLIFGIQVYNDELQIKFTFRFGPMIFGRVVPLRLRITNYCLRSVSSSPLKFTRFIQGNNIASTNLGNNKNVFEITFIIYMYAQSQMIEKSNKLKKTLIDIS
jgi:hypothetical protein